MCMRLDEISMWLVLRIFYLFLFFPVQVCLVMEYAEGGSLYNGESRSCTTEQHFVLQIIRFMFNFFFVNQAQPSHRHEKLNLRLFA